MAGYKSGDSKRQDAAAAVEADRENPRGSETEQLPGILQGRKDELKEQGADALSIERHEDAIKKLTAIIEGMSKRLQMAEGRVLATAPSPTTRMHCSTCGQYLSVCSGKHITVSVLPENPEFYAYFPGVFLNGVLYKGMSTVPVASLNDIAGIVSNYEEGERARRTAGGRMRGVGRQGLLLKDALKSGGINDLLSPQSS